MKKIFALIMALFILASCAAAYNDMTGTKSGNYLKLNGGVRANSMGGAYTAVSDDPDAIFWNPAGMTQLQSAEVTTSYLDWPAGMSNSNISFVIPGKRAAAGFAVNYVNEGSITETTLAKPSGTGNILNPSAVQAYLSGARAGDKLSVGGTLKILSDSIGSDQKFGFGIDAGVLYKANKYLRLGAAFRNAAGNLGLAQLTSSLNFGASLKTDKFLIAADIDIPNDNKIFACLGAEASINDMLFVRAGMNTKTESTDSANVSAGIGLKVKNVEFDYAYVPVSEIGNSHRFAVSFVIPEPKQKKQPK